MKGCQFISLNEDDMTNVQFVTYDEENGQFCMKHMLLCNQHLENFQKLNGDKNISKQMSKRIDSYTQEKQQKNKKEEENKKNVSKETLCSTLEERKTVQFVDEINKINFTCRGLWENGFFRSRIYLGSMEDRSIRVDKEDEKVNSYHPEEYNREYYQSHYQVTIKDGLKLYIIPIMQKNYLNQFTKLLVVTETNLQRSAYR